MKILELTGEPFLWGGQEMFIMNVIRNIDVNHFQIDVFTPYQCENETYKKEVEKVGGRIISNNCSFSPNSFRWNIVLPLIKFLRANHYDIVHIHSGSISVFAICSLCAFFCGIKRIIVHSHSTGLKWSLKTRLIKLIYYPILRFIPTDYLACSYAAGEWKFPSAVLKNLHVIRNGIDLKKYSFNSNIREQMRSKMGVDDNVLLLGHVGRFSFVKNHEFIIKLLDEMIKRGIQCKLVLVGGGELMEDVKLLVVQLNLKEQVIFTGEVSNVSDYMQAMDVFVFPSRWEGLPIVGVEAQAIGVPIVASNKISSEMKLTDDVTFLSLNNMDSWVSTIQKVMTHPRNNNIQALSQKGFDTASLASTISAIYLKK